MANECKLYLIRHGETANSNRNCFNGHFDAALSDNGRDQMQRVASALSKEPIRAVYSSDLKRSVEGARLVAEPHGLEALAVPALKELSVGKWEGLSVDEVNEKYPGEIERRFQTIAHSRVDGGESLQELHDRVVPVIEELASRHAGETIAAVCHGGVNRIILCHLLGIPWEKIYRIKQGFAALNVVAFYPDNAVVELVNATPGQVAFPA